MRILVTGGAGFIGSHLVDTLIQNGYRVSVVDNLSTGLKENLNPKARFYQIDVRDQKLPKIFKKEKPEVVFHLAAQINLRKSIEDPVFDTDVNILGSLNVLEAARKSGTKKIIFSSTGGAIYGEVDEIPTPETYPAMPSSPYGLAKLTMEKYLEIYRQIYGLDYVALRYGNVYGPRQNTKAEAGVIAIFIENLLRGKPCIINGDGRQTRDYIFVDDVVRANLLALEKGSRPQETALRQRQYKEIRPPKNQVPAVLNIGEVGPHDRNDLFPIFNVGTGVETSVNQIFKKIAGIMGMSDLLNLLEGSDLLGRSDLFKYGPAIKGELQRSALDWQKAKKGLGWRPEIDLDKGLQMTVSWFKK